MKRLILLPLTAAAIAASAITLQVSYDATTAGTMSVYKPQTRPMMLTIDGSRSKYFNTMSQYVDSMMSNPTTAAQLREAQRAAQAVTNPDGSVSVDLTRGPAKVITLYIYKNLANNSAEVYDHISGVFGEGEAYVYPETDLAQPWEISDSTKTIIGYECVKAECDWRGRRWTAWFAPEIPVQDGPWKLCGLPGLILEAYADGTPFKFSATGIQQSDAPISELFFKDEYARSTREKFMKEDYHNIDNRESLFQAQYPGARIEYRDDDGNPIEFKSEPFYHYPETDLLKK